MKNKHLLLGVATVVAVAMVAQAGTALADGNVVIPVPSTTNRNLIVTGDSGNNSIVIEGTGMASQFTISSGDGTTTINGSTDPFMVLGANREFKINLGGGNNTLSMLNATVSRSLLITTGDTDNTVSLDNVRTGKRLSLRMGEGANMVTLTGCDITEKSIIRTDNGPDDISIDGSNFRGGIVTKDGDDIISVTNTGHLESFLKINSGRGNDTITLDTLDYPLKILVSASRDDDNVTVGNLTAGKKIVINGSQGTDTLTDNGGNSPAPKFGNFE